MENNRTKSYCNRAKSGKTVLRWHILTILAATAMASTIVTSSTNTAAEKQREASEYQIKAVYLYNFLLFTEWSEDQSDEPKDSIVLAIVGKDPFKDAFKPVEGKDVKGKKLVIKRFDKIVSTEKLKQCDLLFISSSLQKNLPDIIKLLKDHPVLTVSETKGFIESGGMINLLKKKDTVKFEINKAAAERVGIRFRSKLLRVAIRVIEKSHDKEDKK